jgi:FtsZ-binding cell division protein ZapB
LEERLQQKYDAIQQFYHPMSNNSMLVDEYDADASQSQFLNATGSLHHKYGLPSQIDRQKKRAQQEKEQLRKEEEKYTIDYWVYFRKLLECLELLVTLLEEYRLKAFKDFDEVALQWLQERTKTARLKLNVIRYEYLTHTYHTDAIESLKHMRQTLEQEYEQCKRQSGRVERELEQYASVGLGFDKLVDEYTQITAKIKTKKWEIQQLDS